MMASEDKYAHLLQPIRDLAANWNINIASELEDYLVRTHAGAAPGLCPFFWHNHQVGSAGR